LSGAKVFKKVHADGFGIWFEFDRYDLKTAAVKSHATDWLLCRLAHVTTGSWVFAECG
jgi:hypothetical protein